MSKKFEAKSFGITFRPRCGLSASTEERLIKWLNKQPYCHLVIEKSGVDRHAHMQIWSDDLLKRDSIQKTMNRILVDTVEFHDDKDKREQLRHAIKVKMCYNDWLRSYCEDNPDKDDESPRDSVLESVPVDTTDYYPTEQEQALIHAQSTAVDNYMYKLEQKFLETDASPTKTNIATFLSDMMFNTREIQTMRKQIDRINLCNTLYNYINKIIDTNLFLSKEESLSLGSYQEQLEVDIAQKLSMDVEIFRNKITEKNSNIII